MKRILLALFALAAIASAACRIYDVDLRWNANGWTAMGTQAGIRQTFVCTADSLLWAEFFVGAANSGGQHNFDVLDAATNDPVYSGHAAVAGQNYEYVRSDTLVKQAALIKGKEYVLKVSHSDGDSINYYASDLDDYEYGGIEVPGRSHPTCGTSACRIEGVNRAVDAEHFGVTGGLFWYGSDSTALHPMMNILQSVGVKHIREPFAWWWVERVKDAFDWSGYDGLILSAAQHGIKIDAYPVSCPKWVSTHIVQSTQDTSVYCPPCSLYAGLIRGTA